MGLFNRELIDDSMAMENLVILFKHNCNGALRSIKYDNHHEKSKYFNMISLILKESNMLEHCEYDNFHQSVWGFFFYSHSIEIYEHVKGKFEVYFMNKDVSVKDRTLLHAIIFALENTDNEALNQG